MVFEIEYKYQSTFGTNKGKRSILIPDHLGEWLFDRHALRISFRRKPGIFIFFPKLYRPIRPETFDGNRGKDEFFVWEKKTKVQRRHVPQRPRDTKLAIVLFNIVPF